MVEACYMIAFTATLGGIYTDIKKGQLPYVITIPLLLSSLMIVTINGNLLTGILSGTISFTILWIMGLLLKSNDCGWSNCEEKKCKGVVGGGDIKYSAGLGVLIASPVNVLLFLALAFGLAGIYGFKSGVENIKMAPWLTGGFLIAYTATQMGVS